MIISHKYQFIFIKTAKTAGTSLEVFLSQHCGEDDIVTQISPHVEPHVARNYEGMIWNPVQFVRDNRVCGIRATLRHVRQRTRFFNHMTARSVRHLVPQKVWDTYFTFCVERNPWDKTLSHYHMLKHRGGRTISFDEYIERRQFCLNYPLYTDSSGEVIVDKVLKYETLTEELSEIFKRFDIPFEGNLGVRAKSTQRNDRRPYQEVYTEQQRDIVERAFAPEIQLHGYSY
jgi:hypothetical protein